MFPSVNRMRRSDDFGTVVRRGARSRRGPLVVYYCADLHGRGDAAPPLVGLIVGRSVGGSVVRHRVSRRLRAQVTQHLRQVPSGSGIVVRALPGAATARSADLGAAVTAALHRLTGATR